MSGGKHTPGPWKLWTSNSWRRFHGPDGPVCEPIAQNDGHPDLHFRNGGPDGPDARLIEAAPELLEVARAYLRFGPPGPSLQKASAIIARIEGRSQ